MLKKYKFWLVIGVLTAGMLAIAQGCGSSTAPATHTIYGSTS